jgi:flagellar biosynthesis/type III secretory pathway protein FliH
MSKVDYDAGYDEGYNEGLLSGKKFVQTKVLELMDEVIKTYESSDANLKFPAPPISAHHLMKLKKQVKINTAKSIKTLIFNDGQIKNE